MNAPLSHPVIAEELRGGTLLFDVDLYQRLTSFGAFDEVGKVELYDGVIVRMNGQAMPHMVIKGDIAFLLRRALDTLALGYRADTEGSVSISELSVVDPDILIWDGKIGSGFVRRESVFLLVEVADSTLAKDTVLKARMYADARIPEYWVVDVKGRIVHRMTCPTVEGYTDRAVFRFGERIDSATIPGLSIDLPKF